MRHSSSKNTATDTQLELRQVGDGAGQPGTG